MANDAGFTLIEALVAMAVLALGAVALLTATEGHTARITAITDRAAARWVAVNRLAEVRLGLEAANTAGDPVPMFGRTWQAHVTLAPTAQPGLDHVTVAVGPDQGAATPRVLFVLDGYRDAGAISGGGIP